MYLVTIICMSNWLNNWIPRYSSFYTCRESIAINLALPAKQVRYIGGRTDMCTGTAVKLIYKANKLVTWLQTVFLRFPVSFPVDSSYSVLPATFLGSGIFRLCPEAPSEKRLIVTSGLALERSSVSSINWVSGSHSTTYLSQNPGCRGYCKSQVWKVVFFNLCSLPALCY